MSQPNYQIGDIALLSVSFLNSSNAPTNPTTVILTVRAPDGTQHDYTAPDVLNPSTGVFTYNLAIAQSGIYSYNWVGTGALVAAQQGSLTAAASLLVGSRPNPIDLCTIDAVKDWLGSAGISSGSDVLTQRLVTAASLYFMHRLGYMPPNGGIPTVSPLNAVIPVNEWYDGSGTDRQFVRTPPIATVTTLTINGAAVGASAGPPKPGYMIDDGGASIVLIGGSFANASYGPAGGWGGGGFAVGLRFGSGVHNVNLIYTAGYAITPYDLQQACIEMIGETIRKRGWIGLRSIQLAAGGGSTTYASWVVSPIVNSTIEMYRRVAFV